MNKHQQFIINADDCGYNKSINCAIAQMITLKKISSTTIMANMEDLEGAKDLYEQYCGEISFGIHFNLSEGEPLLYSQALLDYGYYKESEGRVIMSGKDYYYRPLPRYIRKEILNEILAQFYCLKDNGFDISHFDSHEHLHTSLGFYPLIPEIIELTGINKMRIMRNVVRNPMSRTLRNLWLMDIKRRSKEIRTSNYFCSYIEYMKNCELLSMKQGIIELMCHPGANLEETEAMIGNDYCKFNVVSYNDI